MPSTGPIPEPCWPLRAAVKVICGPKISREAVEREPITVAGSGKVCVFACKDPAGGPEIHVFAESEKDGPLVVLDQTRATDIERAARRPPRGSSVLIVGCGLGEAATFGRHRFARTCVLDPRSDLVEAVSPKLSLAGIRAEMRVGDLTSIRPEEEQWDWAIVDSWGDSSRDTMKRVVRALIGSKVVKNVACPALESFERAAKEAEEFEIKTMDDVYERLVAMVAEGKKLIHTVRPS